MYVPIKDTLFAPFSLPEGGVWDGGASSSSKCSFVLVVPRAVRTLSKKCTFLLAADDIMCITCQMVAYMHFGAPRMHISNHSAGDVRYVISEIGSVHWGGAEVIK